MQAASMLTFPGLISGPCVMRNGTRVTADFEMDCCFSVAL